MVHMNNKRGSASWDREVRKQSGDAIRCVDLRTRFTMYCHPMLRTLNLTLKAVRHGQDD